jgi:hypothetical protein
VASEMLFRPFRAYANLSVLRSQGFTLCLEFGLLKF